MVILRHLLWVTAVRDGIIKLYNSCYMLMSWCVFLPKTHNHLTQIQNTPPLWRKLQSEFCSHTLYAIAALSIRAEENCFSPRQAPKTLKNRQIHIHEFCIYYLCLYSLRDDVAQLKKKERPHTDLRSRQPLDWIPVSLCLLALSLRWFSYIF